MGVKKIGHFCTICRVPARSAGKLWAFYSVSGEIPAQSAGKFWRTCVASVKFCSLASERVGPRAKAGAAYFFRKISRVLA